jgi:hypothetical protein
MKKTRVVVGLVIACFFMFSPLSFAQDVKFELNKGFGMKEILTSYQGKRVGIRLDSGEEVEGIITTVGDQLVHVSKLSKRDFYDAVVRLDKINAVIFRARSN